jgi:UTP:GlnB (protein PII) uridylyltransferase
VTLNLRAALLALSGKKDTNRLRPLPAGWELELLEHLTFGRLAVRFTAHDAPGLLAEITQFLSDVDADVQSANVRSEGSLAVDDFVIACSTPSSSEHLRSLAKLPSRNARTYWSEWSIEDSNQ